MCCFVRLLSLLAYSYVMKTDYIITVNRLLTDSSNAHKYARAFNAFSFVRKKNIDYSGEGYFALLFLTEEAEIPKKNRRTNKQTHKQTNTQMLLKF